METNASYRGFMAENIAKTYLYETQMLTIYEGEDGDFDFICMLRSDRSVVFGVNIKAAQYTASEIFRKYKSIREKSVNMQIPILMLYINPVDRTGLFEFIWKRLGHNLSELNSINLKTAILHLPVLKGS